MGKSASGYETLLKQRSIEGTLIVRIQELFDLTLGEAILSYFERLYLHDDIRNFSKDDDTDECVEYLLQQF